jgi:hypothetical protein
MPAAVELVGRVKPTGVVYVPFPLTTTTSMSRTPPGPWRVNVSEPVGALPPESVAESRKVGAVVANVTVAGVGLVDSVGVTAAAASAGQTSRHAATPSRAQPDDRPPAFNLAHTRRNPDAADPTRHPHICLNSGEAGIYSV